MQNREKEKSLKTIVNIVYILQTLSFAIGLTLIIGVIINYVKRDDARDTWLYSHFNWQIRTFWFTLLWLIVGGLLINTGLGFYIIMAVSIWLSYRIIKGWLKYFQQKEIK